MSTWIGGAKVGTDQLAGIFQDGSSKHDAWVDVAESRQGPVKGATGGRGGSGKRMGGCASDQLVIG